jgi:DNA repair and recombination protein RAD54B
MLMAGGMDEKIYQRQVSKTGLADSVVDGKKNEGSFSPEELRDLFRLATNPGCQTHDLLGCDCKGLGSEQITFPGSDEDVDQDKEELSDDAEDSDDEMLFPAVVPATKANVELIQKKILDGKRKSKKRKGKEGMQALMHYKHIDASVFKGETEDVFGYELEDFEKMKGILGDDALTTILKEDTCKVNFVFAKHG